MRRSSPSVRRARGPGAAIRRAAPDVADGSDERVTSRGVAAVAVALAVLGVVFSAIGIVLVVANGGALLHNAPGGTFNANVVIGIGIGLTYPLVGVLIALRRPRNPIGWIYLVIALSQGLEHVASQYAIYGLITSPGSLPMADTMAWVAMWAWAPGFVLFSSVSLLLFPDGRHLAPRWRVVTVIAIVSMLLLIVPMAVVAWPVSGIDLVRADTGGDLGPISSALLPQGIGLGLGALAAVASVASLLLRWRRSRGIERAQLKWLAFAASVTFPFFITNLILPEEPIPGLLVILLGPLVPFTIAIAILRYRLFEIDRIINRTLVYVPMTAVLMGIYTASVALSQRVFVAVTGEKSDGAIVFTTLVVVILFTPIKNGLQATVDRRFKEVRDPTAPLAQLAVRFDTRVWLADPTTSIRRLLDVSVRGFGASGGSISLAGTEMATLGEGTLEGALEATAGEGANRVAIAIGPRSNGQPYTDVDRRILEPAVAALARALAGS